MANDKTMQELKLRIKKYLELENVSILAGAGTSFHLGAPIIREVPDELKPQLKNEIEYYFPKSTEPSYEDLFNCLQADKFIKEKKHEDISEINGKINLMQKWLFQSLNPDRRSH